MSSLPARLAELSPQKRELLLRELKKRKHEEAPRPPIRPRERRDEPFPLSYAQQRLWFLDQLEPGNPFYNLPGAIRLTGPLDEPALARSLAGVARRHEVLRTTFSSLSGLPVQRIGPPPDLPLPVVDVSALPTGDRAAATRALVAAAVRRPFDLAMGPVMRALLLRLGTGERILVFALHHIVADGWSLRILVREVTALYAAFAAGAPSPLPDLPVQYADYAAAEQEWLSGPVLAPQLAYWKRRLGGLPGPLDLPGDRPRPEVQTFRGARHPLGFPAETVAGLKELGRRQGATLFMTLLAALMVLLHRYSGREDLAIGTPIANRDRVETEGLIGFFVNTLVLRGELAGDPSFRELLARVRETTLGAFAHPDLPFERLVEELQPERDLRHSPLFQVLFAFQSLPEETRGDSDLRARALPVDSGTSLFELTLSLEETPRRLAGSIEYNTDLFDRSRMARLAGHLQVLLAALASDPDQRLSELPLLNRAERCQLLGEWNDTAAMPTSSPGDCLHQLFEAATEREPDARAVVTLAGALTRGELEERSNRLAHHLRRLGVGPEVPVGICLPRSLGMVTALLAVLKAGGAYLPLDPGYPRERLELMLADSGAPVVLSEERLLDRLPGSLPVVCLDRDAAAVSARPAARPASLAGPGNLAYLIYTSGSTGRPKGVAIEHRSAVALLRWAEAVFPGPERAGVLASTSICFDLSVFELFLPLGSGGTVILADNALELPFLSTIAEVTLVNTVPSAIAELVRGGGLPGSVRTVNLAGEPLPGALVEEIYATGGVAQVWNLYGPSEDTTYSTFTCVPRCGSGPPAIGRPVAGSQAFLLDTRQQLVALGIPGELYLGGAGLARGYLGRPELTAERFVPDPFSGEPGARLYRTGDLARHRPNGELAFLGRLDHQVKVRGFRIELGEVEAALEILPAVQRALVMARPEDQTLVAYVVPVARAGKPVPAELRAALRARLPEYMVPAGFVVLDAFPLTPNGKVDRQALAAIVPGEALPAPSASRALPRTPAEELLAGIWQQVLRRERTAVAVDDNFFDLGGQSLMATRMMSQVRDVFGVELPLRALFEAPTVAGLAARIEAARAAGAGLAAPPLVRVARDGRLPLSFGQQRLWFLHQLEPASAAYNMPSAVRLTGSLAVPALAWSLGEVVRRHEVLRTVFRLAGEEPTQVILPAGEVPAALPSTDLAALPPGTRERELRRLATAEARRPFDLAVGPLLRACLLRLAGSGEEHVLLLCLHHIVADAWSTEVLVRELVALYEVARQGHPSSLPDLPVQYADYAAWQRGWLAGEVLAAQIAYWRRSLAGAPPLLDLPLDRARPAMQTFRGGRRTLALSGEVLEAVRGRCRAEGLTPFMALLAVFELLLGRCSRQETVVVGTPIANRGRAELEELIGFFVNTLALRGDLTGDPTTRALLARVRETALGAYAHQDLPFEKLVEELEPERNLAHSPLFQVLFTFENAPPPAAGGSSAL
ncbi:MAG: hypothetical protein QOJ16_3002, partial [Acidobacteriota bacterium]|nr:hypothetical protein [Acidobacteriota bacterium]